MPVYLLCLEDMKKTLFNALQAIESLFTTQKGLMQ